MVMSEVIKIVIPFLYLLRGSRAPANLYWLVCWCFFGFWVISLETTPINMHQTIGHWTLGAVKDCSDFLFHFFNDSFIFSFSHVSIRDREYPRLFCLKTDHLGKLNLLSFGLLSL